MVCANENGQGRGISRNDIAGKIDKFGGTIDNMSYKQ